MKRFIRPHAGAFACAVLFAVAAGGLAVLVQFTKGSLLDMALKGDGGLTLRQFLRSSLLRRIPVTILDEPLAITVFVISRQGSERWEKAFEKQVRVG